MSLQNSGSIKKCPTCGADLIHVVRMEKYQYALKERDAAIERETTARDQLSSDMCALQEVASHFSRLTPKGRTMSDDFNHYYDATQRLTAECDALRAQVEALTRELEKRKAGPIGYGIEHLRIILARTQDGEGAVELLNGIVGQAIDQRDEARAKLSETEDEAARQHHYIGVLERDFERVKAHADRAITRLEEVEKERDALAAALREAVSLLPVIEEGEHGICGLTVTGTVLYRFVQKARAMLGEKGGA
jgi:chromosome segregation ATPase